MQGIIKQFYDLEVVKVGEFVLKSGDKSPFYVDLRIIPSVPMLFKQVIDEYVKLVRNLPYKPEAIAGIMSAGIPFATGISLELDIPLLQIRKEAKSHGISKLIEGRIPPKNSKIVLVDDLVSTGASKITPQMALKKSGLVVEDLIVFLDRINADGKQILSENNLKLHSSINLQQMLTLLIPIVGDEHQQAKLKSAMESW